MKIFIYTLFFLFLLQITAYSQTLFAKEKDELFGFVDSLGNTVIPFQYGFVFSRTIETIGFVAHGYGKIKAIDKNNNLLFSVFKYDNGPDDVEEGLFRIEDDETGYIGFADMEGNIMIPPSFFFAWPFHEGFSAFNEGGYKQREGEYSYIAGGKWGYINKKGEIIFPAIFDKASAFENGQAKVEIGDRTFYLKTQPE